MNRAVKDMSPHLNAASQDRDLPLVPGCWLNGVGQMSKRNAGAVRAGKNQGRTN